MKKRLKIELGEDGEMMGLDELASDLSGLIVIENSDDDAGSDFSDDSDEDGKPKSIVEPSAYSNLESLAETNFLVWLALGNLRFLDGLAARFSRLLGYDDSTFGEEEMEN